MTRVVIFAPRGAVASDLADADPSATIALVRWGDRTEVTPDGTVILAQPVFSSRIVAALSRTLPGRMLVRILPIDTGVRFWRSTRRSAEIAALIRDADLIVAAERDAGFAVWQWHGRAGAARAVRGFPAARTWLRQRRQSGAVT